MTPSEQLSKLIIENPGLEIVPIVDDDVCNGDYPRQRGEIYKCRVDEILLDNSEAPGLNEERLYLKSADEEEMKENIYDHLEENEPDWSDKAELSKKADGLFGAIKWKRVILAYIGAI